MRLEKSEPEGDGWEESATGFSGFVHCLPPASTKRVTVTFPDGKVHRFEPRFPVNEHRTSPCQAGGIAGGFVGHVPVPPTRGSVLAASPGGRSGQRDGPSRTAAKAPRVPGRSGPPRRPRSIAATRRRQ